jgi:hypothetical protein
MILSDLMSSKHFPSHLTLLSFFMADYLPIRTPD